MKSPSLVVVATTLVVVFLVWDVFGAPAKCPECDGKEYENETVICAQEKELPVHANDTSVTFLSNFGNFCEMLQFNCKHNRRYSFVHNGTCVTIKDKPWERKNPRVEYAHVQQVKKMSGLPVA